MVPSPALHEALTHYDRALSNLEAISGDRPVLPSLILEVLTQRDAVQVVLDNLKAIPAKSVLRLSALDARLQQQKNAIATTPQLGHWRTLTHAAAANWWWYPDPPALHPCLEKRYAWLDHLDWLWTFCSLFFLTLAFTVVLATLNRVMGNRVGTAGMFPVIVQVLLTLSGGAAALTSQGRKLQEVGMARLRIPKHYWQEFSALVSLIVLLFVVGIHDFYLPNFATNRYHDGIIYHHDGQFDSALQAYQQAIALQPDFIAAHYDLGRLYEDLERPDAAIAEYQLVVSSDPKSLDQLTWLRAHNNLGRLYILQEDYQAAWIPLERALNSITRTDLENPDMGVEHYNLQKNMGWMWWKMGRLLQADEALSQAIALNPQRAAAHCLKAQVLEAQEQSEAAIKFWQTCLSGERRVQVEEAEWAAIARERLVAGSISNSSTSNSSTSNAGMFSTLNNPASDRYDASGHR